MYVPHSVGIDNTNTMLLKTARRVQSYFLAMNGTKSAPKRGQIFKYIERTIYQSERKSKFVGTLIKEYYLKGNKTKL